MESERHGVRLVEGRLFVRTESEKSTARIVQDPLSVSMVFPNDAVAIKSATVRIIAYTTFSRSVVGIVEGPHCVEMNCVAKKEIIDSTSTVRIASATFLRTIPGALKYAKSQKRMLG